MTGKHDLLDSSLIQHPFGMSFRRHTFSLTNGILAAPIFSFLGPIPTYNALVLFHAFLTAFSFFYLARELGADRLSSLVASALFTWWPARLVHAGIHLNLASTGWMVLALLFLIRACQAKNWKSMMPAVLFFVLTGAASWHLHQQLCMLFLLIPFLRYKPGIPKKQCITRAFIIFLFGSFLLTPMIIPLIENDPDIPVISLDESAQYSIEPIALLIPSAGSPFFKSLVAPYYSAVPGNVIENTGFIGYSVLILLIIGFLRGGYHERLLVIVGAFFLILAFGPYISVGALQIPLPGKIISSLPILNYSRTPGRFMIAVGLLWCLSCALIMTTLTQKKQWLLCLFGMCFLFEFFPGAHNMIYSGELSEFKIDSVEQSTGILVVPNDWSNQCYMLAQTSHQKPMTTGFTSRMPETVFQRIDGIPYLAGLSDPLTAYETMMVMKPLDWVRIRDLLAVDTVIFFSRFCDPIPETASSSLAHLQPTILESSLNSTHPNLVIDLFQFTEKLTEPECFMLDRWSGPENWGSGNENTYWGLFPAARMRVLGASSSFLVSFELLAAHQSGDNPINVDFIINHQTIHSVTLKPENGWVPISLQIDLSSSSLSGVSSLEQAFHDIWFDFSSGTAPIKLHSSSKHLSSDTRQLSVAIRRLNIKNVES